MAEVPSVLLTSSSVTDSVTLTGEQTVGPGRPHLAGAKAVLCRAADTSAGGSRVKTSSQSSGSEYP